MPACVVELPGEVVTAQSNAQGWYRLEAPQGGLLVIADACGGTPSTFGWSTGAVFSGPIEPGGSGTADMVLIELGGVYGQVVDDAGQPVSGVCVGAGAATDAQGRFAVVGLDPGEQPIGFAAAGRADCLRYGLGEENPTVEVHSGAWSGPVTLVAFAVGPIQ